MNDKKKLWYYETSSSSSLETVKIKSGSSMSLLFLKFPLKTHKKRSSVFQAEMVDTLFYDLRLDTLGHAVPANR